MPRTSRPCLLLTGFEPFGGESRNPSQDLVQRLAGETVGGLRIVAEVLPCVFAEAPARLEAAIARCSPRLVLAIGQAGGRSVLSFERVAINLIDARIPDNAGAQPIDQPVEPGGPAAYFSTLPVKAMAAAARATGVPAEVSYTAGSFVCNQVFYALMHRLRRRRVPAALLHVPWLPGQAAGPPSRSSMALDTMAEGLHAALAAAVERVRAGQGDLEVGAGTLN